MNVKEFSFVLILILAFAFVTRVARLHLPERYIFDEVYHAVTAKLIARGDPRAFEWWHPAPEPNTAIDWLHPPLAKFTQALGILAFGENTFGWRISSALFGVLVIWITAVLAKELSGQHAVGAMAGLLASLDGLLLVQSRIAMNDIHVTFFILAAALAYWRLRQQRQPWRWLVLSILLGLAIASKWSGLFIIIFVFAWEILTLLINWARRTFTFSFSLSQAVMLMVSAFIIPLWIYISVYGMMFAQGKSLFCYENQIVENVCYKEEFKSSDPNIPSSTVYISHFAELHRQIWWYQTNLKATHGYQSRPWQWLWDLKPVWYHVEYAPAGEDTIANIYAFGNPALFWLGNLSVVATFIWASMRFLQRKTSPQLIGAVFALTAYLIVWLPWQFSPRIMFFYHYAPAVPFLCILLAWQLVRLARWQPSGLPLGKGFTLLAVLAIATTFAIWYPNWTGIAVPTDFAQKVYFALPSWK
jgi:dolichyl-phosphate-mannose-protein mannosyltransferase